MYTYILTTARVYIYTGMHIFSSALDAPSQFLAPEE